MAYPELQLFSHIAVIELHLRLRGDVVGLAHLAGEKDAEDILFADMFHENLVELLFGRRSCFRELFGVFQFGVKAF